MSQPWGQEQQASPVPSTRQSPFEPQQLPHPSSQTNQAAPGDLRNRVNTTTAARSQPSTTADMFAGFAQLFDDPKKLAQTLVSPLFDWTTYSTAMYLLLAFPLGLSYFIALVVMISVGVSLIPVVVGIPLLLLTLAACRSVGSLERHTASSMLHGRIAAPTPIEDSGNLTTRAKRLMDDSYTWRSLFWLALRFPMGIAGFTLVLVGILFPFIAGFGLFLEFVDGGVYNGGGEAYFFAVLAPFEILGFAWLLRGLRILHLQMATFFLGQSQGERTRELEERTTVLESRTELAHELHDSVGHAMTAVTLQAGAAEHVFDQNPEFARQALRDIRTRGTEALGELDRILGALSDQDPATTAPLAGLSDLPNLIAQTRRAGTPVAAVFDGEPATVPDDISRTVYRVVQESLTNVMKYAGDAETAVVVDITAREVHVEIQNERPTRRAHSVPSGGRGLAGLEERVTASGGIFNAGATANGGFLVTARIPLHRSTTSPHPGAPVG